MPEIEVQKCSLCQRERTLGDGEHPMDAYDYSPLQVMTRKPVGWYSGDDGEMCPECFTSMMGGRGPA